jgi:hypothetical protein
VAAEVVVMVVLLPVQAEARAEARRVIVQFHHGSALVRLPVPLRLVPASCKTNHTPPLDNPHSPYIPSEEGLGVIEIGIIVNITIVLRLPM